MLQFSVMNGRESSDDDEIGKTLQLLEKGKINIILSNNKDIVLVLGNTGSGKSTLLQWIVGDDSKLISKEIEDSGDYIIEDGGARIGSSMDSMTIFPELVEPNNTAYYDCPGFSDTRSSSHEIAITYFIKELCDHAESVKMIFAVNHSSVRTGVDRKDFMKLLTHTTEFIKDVKKFSKSVALVVTKVENLTIKKGKNYVLVGDDVVIHNIASFLENVKFELNSKAPPDSKKDFYKNATDLIEIFLKKESDRYTRISLFRRPDEPGPLSEIELMVKQKKVLQTQIDQDLQFTVKIDDDFGYTISGDSQNKIKGIIGKINEKVLCFVSEIGSNISDNIKTLVETEMNKIQDFAADNGGGNLKSNKIEAKKFATQFGIGKIVVENLKNLAETLQSIDELTKLLHNDLPKLDIEFPTETVTKISDQNRFFKFLQKVSKDELKVDSFAWSAVFQSVLVQFNSMEQNIRNSTKIAASEIKRKIDSEIQAIEKELMQKYQKEEEEMSKKIQSFTGGSVISVDILSAQQFSKNFTKDIVALSKLVADLENANSMLESAKVLAENFAVMKVFSLPEIKISNVVTRANQVEYIEALTKQNLNQKPAEWVLWLQNDQSKISSGFDALKNEALKTSETLSKSMNSNFIVINSIITNHFSGQIQSSSLQILPASLKFGQDMLTTFVKKIGKMSNFIDFSQELNLATSGFNLTGSKIEKITTDLVMTENCFNFLKQISNDINSISFSTFSKPFESTATYLRENANWFEFLNGIYNKFSEFEFQSGKNRYNVKNIADWGLENKQTGIQITKENFKKFMTKIGQYEISGQDQVQSFEPSDRQILGLNKVIDSTLKSEFDKVCIDSESAILRGDFIKFSDLFGPDGKLLDFCKSGKKLKSLKLFALKTIFIDRNFDAVGNKLELTLVAPNWEVVGDNRKISLNGEAGKSHENNTGGFGSDGKAGLPGGTAGSFFGIADRIKNSEQLTITVNGGRGGKGQDGKEGRDGQNGVDGEIPDKNCDYKGSREKEHLGNAGDLVVGIAYNQDTQLYKYTAKAVSNGTSGLKGGGGGKSGIGGHAGRIEIFSLKNKDKSGKQLIIGANGAVGIGGKGGLGGKHGRDSVTMGTCHKKYAFFVVVETTWSRRSYNFIERGSSSTGAKGNDGFVGQQKLPEPQTSVEKAIVLNEFKVFLRDNLDNLKEISLNNFHKSLDENQQILGIYNTLSYVDEMNGLEEQFHNLDDNSLQFYESLLHRVNKYSLDVKGKSYKKVLIYLYTAILSKISVISSDWYSGLVIDLEKFFSSTTQNIKTLQSLANDKSKSEIINKQKLNYQEKINQKIKEAENLITSEIMPAIDDSKVQIDNEIDTLLKEAIKLKEAAEKEKEKLEKNRRMMEDAMRMKTLCNSLSAVGQVASLLGPYGAVAGSVIGIGASVGESFIPNPETGTSTIKLPSGVANSIKSLMENWDKFRTRESDKLKKVIGEIETNLIKDESVSDLLTKTKEIRGKIDGCKDDPKKLKELEKEFKKELEKKEKDLKAEGSKNASVINDVIMATKVLELGFDVYNKYKNDAKKLDQMSEAIAQSEKKIQELRDYEDKIHRTMTPMMQNMVTDMNDVADNLNGKSQVSLDITKWKVQSVLKDIRLQMIKFTKGFQVEESLARCIEKLDEAMTTMIVVYDRIQSFQDQQHLANFIAEVSSPRVGSIQISDPKLAAAVADLEIKIRSNLILQQHKTAMKAFKQWVFPFANVFLRDVSDLNLPSSLKQNETELSTLAENAVKQLEVVSRKLIEYKSMVTNHDKHIVCGLFNSSYDSSNSFFTWKNQNYRHEIAQLLSGGKVVIKADVAGSDANKDAIKFNLVNFELKSATKQNELNKLLKSFTITATHLGNSYYKFDDQVYVVASERQEIFYSFERDRNDIPIKKNNVYEKIEKGDLMLSPYAMWEIHLSGSGKNDFLNDLKTYSDAVDLEMVGRGCYVQHTGSFDEFSVEKYYKNELITG